MKITGDTVRQIRGDLTQEEFAAKVGCSYRQVVRWESHGQESFSPLPVFRRRLASMAKRLGVDLG